LGHSALRFTIKQIFGNEKYSRQAYLLDQWIGIPFREPDGGVKAGTLGTCSLILILPEGFPVNFLAFFWGVRLEVAFRLPARVLEALAPAPADGWLGVLSPGGWVETGMARIGTWPSKPGIGEMKLSRAYIQTKKI
jgi:hypothetical protein